MRRAGLRTRTARVFGAGQAHLWPEVGDPSPTRFFHEPQSRAGVAPAWAAGFLPGAQVRPQPGASRREGARVRAALSLALALLALLCLLPAARAAGLPEFLISTGWPPAEADSAALAQALAKARFNTVLWPLDKLEVCRGAGLKLMAEGVRPEAAARLAADPALWGYHLADEPKAPAFPGLAKQVEEFRRADSKHPANINLVCYAGELLHLYMRTVKPEILSYDHYQWWWGAHSHFEKLEQHRAAALAADIPLTCWVEVNANPGVEWGGDRSCDPENAVKLRQSVYTSLAYGVKGIQWFSADLLFKPGTAELNECGQQVARLNAELEKLGPTLLQLRSLDVFHTKPLPRRTSESQHDHWAQVSGEALLWGMFKDAAGTDYILVANRDIHQRQQALVQFQLAGYGRKVKSVQQLDKKTGAWIQLGANIGILFVVNLDPGDGQLFKVLKAAE